MRRPLSPVSIALSLASFMRNPSRRRVASMVLWGVLAASASAPSRLARADSHLEGTCRYCAEHATHVEDGAHAVRVSGAEGTNPDESAGRKYSAERDVDVLHLRIDVTPDFPHRSITGTTTVRFVPLTGPLTQLRLNAVDLDVKAVRSTDKVRDHVTDGAELTIVFDPPLAAGKESQVEIDYTATPRMGLYFRTKEMGYDAGDTHVWTQGETHEARHWFPCFDHPNERATTEVICRLPADMMAYSNGELLSEAIDPTSGLKVVHWSQKKPHANYLVCLVAGYFKTLEKKHRDVPLRFITQPSLIEHAANSFADTEQIMEFYEQEIGLNFPWNKYDQITIVDFMWGGMENTSITTLTHRTIFSTETENISSSRGLDAHEMAHQWFGDYVTCRDWSHLWLNEGFATFYTHLYEGHKFGRDAMLYGLYQDAEENILRNVDDKRPIVYRDYTRSMEQFDYRAYPKGSWVLHMLRSQLGEATYRTAIRQYLERHALGNASTADLARVFEEVSGRSWDAFFDQWVHHARFPDVKVDYSWLAEENLAQIRIRQTQTVDKDVPLFHFPVTLRFKVGDQVIDERVEVTEADTTFAVGLSAQPTVFRFDPEYSLLARVTLDLPEKMVLEQLKDPADMIGRLRAIKALGDRKTTAAMEALTKALREDPFHGVRLAACEALADQGGDEAWKALEGSLTQPDARVRNAVTRALARVYRPEALQVLGKIVDSEKNPAIVATAVRGLAKFNTPEAQARLRTMLHKASFENDISMSAVSAIRAQDDPAFLPDLLAWAASPPPDLGRRNLGEVLETIATLARDESDKSAVSKLLLTHLQGENNSLKSAAIRGLAILRDRGTRAQIAAFADIKDERLAGIAKEALQKLDTQADFAPKEVAELRQAVEKLGEEQKSLKSELEQLRTRLKAKEDSAPASAPVPPPAPPAAPPPPGAPAAASGGGQ